MARPFVPIIHGAVLERADEADTLTAAGLIAASLERLGYDSEIIALGLDLSVLEGLAARRPYAVFNLVESLNGDAALSYLAPAALDHVKLAYSGARTTPYFITLSKLLTKDALRAHGLPTADWWRAGETVPAERTVVIKSVLEHGSLGMDTGSIVPGRAAAQEIARREAKFGGAFFAEAFVGGREFTIGVLEQDGRPRVLPIVELDFTKLPESRVAFMDFSAKWNKNDPAYPLFENPLFGLETREAALASQLGALALRAWDAFGLSGYARIDIRLDTEGHPFILEVNVNPSLALDACFAGMAAQVAIGYDTMITAILTAARSAVKAAA